MPTSLLPLTAGFLLLAGTLTAQEGLQSARNALAEALPDVAAIRIERYLATHSDLGKEERAQAYLLLGESLLRARQPAKAQEALKRVPDEHSAERHYWQGITFAHQHNSAAALEKLALVPAENPLYEQALFNVVELQFNQDETTTALAILKKIREHNPEFLPSEIALLEAQIHLQNSEPDKAYQSWETLSKDKQQSPASQLLAGRIELARNNSEAALTSFSTVLASNTSPSSKRLALLGKCDVLLTNEASKQAIEPLLTLLAEENDSSLLDLLQSRFETLLSQLTEANALSSALVTFAQPETLGEDSNYATPPKLFACYYLSRISEPETALNYLTQIVSLSPEGDLTARAHLLQAKIALTRENSEAANEALKAVQKAAPEGPLASQAADILARLSVANGDLKEAEELFTQASQHPQTAFAEQALLNQAVLQLTGNANTSLSALSAKLNSNEAKISLELEQALALAKKKNSNANDALQQFILRHPKHPRLAQARLALASVLLGETQPDFELIEAQLSSLPEELTQALSRQSFHVSHRLAAATNKWTNAVNWGERHSKDFPQSQNDPYFLLSLAECSFQDGNHNRARFLFSKIANLPDAGELAPLSLLYAAHSNLLIPTSEATAEALDILDDIIAQAGPLSTRARLLKARTLLKSLGQAKECLKTLEGIPGKPGDQPEAALLTAQAYRELATNDPKISQRAISLYQNLLNDPRTSYQLSNQIHYQLALTYRESGHLNLAIDPCLRVIDLENKAKDEKEIEWDYYYRCGFEAIDILLTAKRARAALTLARKLAQTGGPGAAQAQERAKQIQLDHLLWTD